MKTTEEILSKLRKVLALANGRNATKGEVEAAMAAARRIADEHDIDLASVDFNAEVDKQVMEVVRESGKYTRSARMRRYHVPIYQALRQVFGIRVLLLQDGYIFVGTTSDVAICKMLFPWLEKMFLELRRQAIRDMLIDDTRDAARSFWHGVSEGIVANNRRDEESKPEEVRSKLALVRVNKQALVDKRYAEMYPKVRTTRYKAGQSATAASVGYAAGRKITLRQTGAGGRPAGYIG